jgi:hypothetical protein
MKTMSTPFESRNDNRNKKTINPSNQNLNENNKSAKTTSIISVLSRYR